MLRLLPVAALVGCAWALAWDTLGSIEAAAWLPYAAGVALVLAAVLLSGAAARPGLVPIAAAAALLGLAGWTALTLRWSAVPALARDEALLTAAYAVAFVVPLVTLRFAEERLAAIAVVVAGLSSLALATAFELRLSEHSEDLYQYGRLDFPISYPNATAAIMLVGFWPAVGLAAHRELPTLVRSLSLGGATAMLACWLLAQSKGGGFALAVSGIVLFAACPFRLRLLAPTAIAAALVALAAVPLTEPFRAGVEETAGAVRDAGAVTMWLAAAGATAGAAYAALDRYLWISPGARRRVGALALAAVVAGLAAGVGTFFVAVDRPVGYLADAWSEFKSGPQPMSGSTHLGSLGSNRYDFWRVALDEFTEHPLAGIGARGFGPAYLVEGRSLETPARAHSVEMDVLGETGAVGFAVLVAGGALLLAALWRGARASPAGACLLGAGVYWLAHSSVDWVWTFPAVGLPAFCLLGIGASPEGTRRLPTLAAVPAGVAALALAVSGFAPPWLSAKLVDRAYAHPSEAGADLRWARRLDPLSTDPLVAEATLAEPPGGIAPLERAVAAQPRRPDLRYLLGIAYLEAGRRPEARRELEAALRLYPRDLLARRALRRAQ